MEVEAAEVEAAFGRCPTFIARAPNSREPADSPASAAAGETATTKVVRQLPPIESASMCVSFESRYGTCVAPDASAFITFDSPSRLELMLIASLICLPERS